MRQPRLFEPKVDTPRRNDLSMRIHYRQRRNAAAFRNSTFATSGSAVQTIHRQATCYQLWWKLRFLCERAIAVGSNTRVSNGLARPNCWVGRRSRAIVHARADCRVHRWDTIGNGIATCQNSKSSPEYHWVHYVACACVRTARNKAKRC